MCPRLGRPSKRAALIPCGFLIEAKPLAKTSRQIHLQPISGCLYMAHVGHVGRFKTCFSLGEVKLAWGWHDGLNWQGAATVLQMPMRGHIS